MIVHIQLLFNDILAIAQLKKEGNWKETDKETEEEEHSLEMHLPYIRKMFEGYISKFEK